MQKKIRLAIWKGQRRIKLSGEQMPLWMEKKLGKMGQKGEMFAEASESEIAAKMVSDDGSGSDTYEQLPSLPTLSTRIGFYEGSLDFEDDAKFLQQAINEAYQKLALSGIQAQMLSIKV